MIDVCYCTVWNVAASTLLSFLIVHRPGCNLWTFAAEAITTDHRDPGFCFVFWLITVSCSQLWAACKAIQELRFYTLSLYILPNYVYVVGMAAAAPRLPALCSTDPFHATGTASQVAGR